MAGLNLLPRKCFELLLDDGTVIPGQFGTWALSRFGQKRKIGLGKIMEIFNRRDENGNNIADPEIMDILDFVVCAIEYKEREAGQPVRFNELKLSAWIDAYTETTGEGGVLMKLFSHSSGEQQEEKKSQPGETSNGANLSAAQPVPELTQ
jgi:hypothetical protein